jgi:hypothetical protein
MYMQFGSESDYTHNYNLCQEVFVRPIIRSKVKMRSLDMLLDKFNAYNSCVEVYIYSQEDEIAITIVIRRIILRRIFRKWDGGGA